MGSLSILRNLALHRPRGSRLFSALSTTFPPGFSFWPNFFSKQEQYTLLAASLLKLDSLETRYWRQKRKSYFATHSALPGQECDPAALFAPDQLYDFQEGHFDGVIHHYREAHLSEWPVEKFPALQGIIQRLHALCPTSDIQTHLLHLASYGSILPHVDNVGASGSWILGVSLGDERILRMTPRDAPEKQFSLSLPSGSVYLQRDDVRFTYEHSIEFKSGDNESLIRPAQRLSVMIRDQKPSSSP